MTSLQT